MQPNLRADKFNDKKVTTIIRRMIPGECAHYADAYHPALEPLGLLLHFSVAVAPQRVAGEFLGPTLSTRPPWVKSAIDAQGEWVLVLDEGFGSGSADALWLIQAVDRPSDLLSKLERQGVATDALILTRQVKGKWIVAVQSSILGDVIKKSNYNTF